MRHLSPDDSPLAPFKADCCKYSNLEHELAAQPKYKLWCYGQGLLTRAALLHESARGNVGWAFIFDLDEVSRVESSQVDSTRLESRIERCPLR